MQVILQVDQRPKQNHKDAILPAHPQELYLLGKEIGLMLNHKKSLSGYFVSKKLINLLRDGSLPRDKDGVIEFWRIKNYFQGRFVIIGLTKSGRAPWPGGGGHKKRYQYCTVSSGTILYLRSLQGHSGQSYWSFMTGQCLDSGRFLQVHLSRRMCNQFTFEHQFRIDIRRSKFEQQTANNTRILARSTWEHRVLHNTRTKHERDMRTQKNWFNINLAQKKGLKFYQTRPNVIILYETLPAYCISSC